MRHFAAEGIKPPVVRSVALFVNILLGTYWLSILYGKGFLALLPARALKNAIMTPINSLIFYTVYNSLLQLFRRSVHHA